MPSAPCIRTADLKQRARAFSDYWLSLPRTDLIPHRGDFEPAKLKPILDTFMIFQIVEPDHFRIRLAGTTVIENYGREVTGQNYLDFRTDTDRPVTREAMNLIVTHPCAQLVRQHVSAADGIDRVSESFGLPMRDDTGHATLMYYQVDDVEIGDWRNVKDRYLLSKKTITRHFVDIGNGVPDFPQVGELN